MNPRQAFSSVAAVDLGSNSFHMVVAKVAQGQIEIVDRLRERVALGAGFDESKRLTAEVQERALACLSRFGQRVRDMPQGSVRAVGTNALRLARNSRAFLDRAREALGHPIEVIAGPEEARLIYLGVAHSVPDAPGRRLVVDIGGGSTEVILGDRFDPLLLASLFMGCVSWSLRFFPRDEISRDRFDQAQIAAMVELESIERRFRRLAWQSCVGASGTILSVAEILAANGWAEGGITLRGLKQLRKSMAEAGHASRLALAGLSEDRRTVLAGGTAILIAAFESLRIERMDPSPGALREGLLYDLFGRIRHEDVRDRTIQRLVQRYQLDVEQASRVERIALALFEQVRGDWDLPEEEGAQFLQWAARLHEIGLSLSYSGYHKHGAYIVAHSEMPGFSREDQLFLATLIRTHRQKITPRPFRDLPGEKAEQALRLGVLLRLAIHLARSRSERLPPAIRLRARRSTLDLDFPPNYLREHPLTRVDLQEESRALREVDLKLELG